MLTKLPYDLSRLCGGYVAAALSTRNGGHELHFS